MFVRDKEKYNIAYDEQNSARLHCVFKESKIIFTYGEQHHEIPTNFERGNCEIFLPLTLQSHEVQSLLDGLAVLGYSEESINIKIL